MILLSFDSCKSSSQNMGSSRFDRSRSLTDVSRGYKGFCVNLWRYNEEESRARPDMGWGGAEEGMNNICKGGAER